MAKVWQVGAECTPSFTFRDPALAAHELAGAAVAAAVGYLWPFLVVVTTGVDAVLDASDPLPFLALHFLQVSWYAVYDTTWTCHTMWHIWHSTKHP
jgi:hypothetical protein